MTYELVHAELGSCKEKLDQVDLELPVITAVESFGRFLKYLVEEQKEKEGESSRSTASRPNAFDVLMNSQRALQHFVMSRKLPEPVHERNKKDKLCKLCRPIRLPREVFYRIKQLPFPVPGEDGHYKAFQKCLEVMQVKSFDLHRRR